jgi:hypothetical protein
MRRHFPFSDETVLHYLYCAGFEQAGYTLSRTLRLNPRKNEAMDTRMTYRQAPGISGRRQSGGRSVYGIRIGF